MSGLSKIRKNRLLELLIAVVFVAVFVYVLSMTMKVTTGVSQTIEPPDHVVRLQVLNGCGVRGLAANVSDRLADYYDEDIQIQVVDTDNFDLTEVPESFLIARTRDRESVRVLAKKLGIDPGNITYKMLENNYRHVSATLVLGKDFQSLRLINDERE
jgi:hypothetical protein